MSILRVSAFAVVMLLYLSYPAYLVYQQEAILEKGTAYQLRLQPVDPVDVFRGRYLELDYELPIFPNPEGLEPGETVYLPLRKDSLGEAKFSRILTSAPEDGDYLRTDIAHTIDDSVMVRIPENLQRYYLNERTAPLAERAVMELDTRRENAEQIRAYAQVRVWNGKVRIEELLFNGLPLREYLEQRVTEE